MESLLTVLQFAFTSLNNINPKELKFFFGSEEEKKEHELDERNRIILTPQFPMSCVYYFETIEVRYKNKNIICFEFLVYINKENNIIIDLDEEKDISFELLFYSKNEKFIPTYLTYKIMNTINLKTMGINLGQEYFWPMLIQPNCNI